MSEPWHVPDPEAGRADEERHVDVEPEQPARSESVEARPDAVRGAIDVQEQVEPPD